MKKTIAALLILAASLFCQTTGFRGMASEQSGLKMFLNPSLLGYEPGARLFIFDEYDGDVEKGLGLGINLGTIGFSYFKDRDDLESYVFATGSEVIPGYYTGSAIRWFSGSILNPELDLSLTIRPLKYFSIAGNVKNIWESNTLPVNSNIGLAIRPFGDNKLTVEGDISFDKDNIEDSYYTIGASTEIIKGINLNGGYTARMNNDDFDPVYEFGFSLSLNNTTAGTRGFKYEDSDSYLNFIEFGDIAPPSFFKLKNSKIIEIELEGEYKEETSKNFLSRIFGGRGKSARELIGQINKLKDDKEVAAILIKSKNYKMTFAQREELRNALVDFKNSGKRIYSYFVTASQSGFYILSVSDKIYMYPEGELAFEGMGAELMFFKGILDKLGVKMQAIRHGKFKSAVEPFTQEQASAENLEQIDKFITRIDDHMKACVSSGRKMTVEQLNDLMNRVPFYTGKTALENKMVDELIIEDKLEKAVRKDENDKAKIVSSKLYFELKTEDSQWSAMLDRQVAIVYATGSIMTGKSSGGGFLSGERMGSDTTAELIRKARKDKNVKAIVFRVDSGGGSGLASDLILTELKLAQEENKKPVIISMGSMAASGGYWISCYGDRIFADKTTLTGSIGVFGLVPSVDGLLGKVGINTQKIRKNKFAVQSWYEDLNQDETDFMQMHIDSFYKGFVEKVADARKKSFDEIDKIAEGRVWAGEDALEIGLIDEIGDLNDAVKYAAEKVKVDLEHNNSVKIYTKFSEFSFGDIALNVFADKLDIEMLDKLKNSEIYDLLSSDETIFMMMPYQVELK
ncbi:MAG TPA: signal peptide peptidase SppA [Clostridiales bacterium]|nr:signal peptide peptidase SppA [Clostridiales bacterium]HQP69737.1 signal peptide peptidase SppA [Clostridiales bacterium]